MSLPSWPDIEAYRDYWWRREAERRIETVSEAETFVEEAGFIFAMTDARRPGASLYIGVCGRRDAHMPRNVQKDPEASLTWRLKDDVLRRGRVFYAKLSRGLATFVAPRLIPHFNAVWGVRRRQERAELSANANIVLRTLRKEWEMASSDLRTATKLPDRKSLTSALDELQRSMKVIPSDVLYEPWFTYIWSLPEVRFGPELKVVVSRQTALREIARAFLNCAGMTRCGELAKVTGLSRVDAGQGNWALVDEGYAVRIEKGVYAKKTLLDDAGIPA
jgi:hypothetical protein